MAANRIGSLSCGARTCFPLAAVLVIVVGLAAGGCTFVRGKALATDGLPPAGAGKPAAGVQFEDVTERAGIRFEHRHYGFGEKYLPETMGSGGGFLDFDGDGWLDLLLLNTRSLSPPPAASAANAASPAGVAEAAGTSAGAPAGTDSAGGQSSSIVLYRNRGDGTFADVTAGSGVEGSLYAMGCAVGDYDNDGRDDLFVTAVNEPNRLFRNLGGGKFQDVTERMGVGDRRWGASCAFLDFDRDGWLDLFVANYLRYEWAVSDRDCFNHPDGSRAYCDPRRLPAESGILYRNQGGKRFLDVSAPSGIAAHRGKGLGVALCDFDLDGWLDILVANDTEPNFLFRNQQDGTFKELGMEAGIAIPETGEVRAGMGIDAADCFNDGRVGVLITNFSGEGLSLFRQDAPRKALFTNVSAHAGTYDTSLLMLGFGLCFFDYDNDGWQDAVVANGHIQPDVNKFSTHLTYPERNQLYRNRGDGSFEEVGNAAGAPFAVERVSRGVAAGDYDNDGDLDLLVTNNNGPAELLQNQGGSRSHWLQLELTGTRSSRNGLGARVEVEAGGVRQRQWVRSGGSYLSASMRRLHFGLGTHPAAERVTIYWPGGTSQTLRNVPADQRLLIQEK